MIVFKEKTQRLHFNKIIIDYNTIATTFHPYFFMNIIRGKPVVSGSCWSLQYKYDVYIFYKSDSEVSVLNNRETSNS